MIYFKNYHLFIILINFILFKLIISEDCDQIVKYKDTENLNFHKDRKNLNGIIELLCKEEEDDPKNLCPKHEIERATCKNKNYQIEETPAFHCDYENLKEEVSVKDYNIKCKEYGLGSYCKDTCSLTYILKLKKIDNDDSTKKTEPLVIVIYILGVLSALILLTVIIFISYKQMRKYRTRRFSVYPD